MYSLFLKSQNLERNSTTSILIDYFEQNIHDFKEITFSNKSRNVKEDDIVLRYLVTHLAIYLSLSISSPCPIYISVVFR